MDAIASRTGWQKLSFVTSHFILTGYSPTKPTSGTVLTVYLEGDGLAWITPHQPSDDPTPSNPVALALAVRHPTKAVAYLARPCQNVGDEDRKNCTPSYWTNRRFSPEVVQSTSEAIDGLIDRFGAKQLILVGYSGGGAIAALVASQRKDVIRLITIAGNLDTQLWTRHHRVSPLLGSMNPADLTSSLSGIPQLHMVGGRDHVVPPSIVQAFAQRLSEGSNVDIRTYPTFDHTCCWTASWPDSANDWITLTAPKP